MLRRLLGWEETPFGTIFDMSVGYNLEGIKTPRMTRFMNQMADASAELGEIQAILKAQFPQFADYRIPSQLTNSVTLSTMHGCPPDEIERIARYLLEERGLHTVVKMNPTLLGKDRVLSILHDDLGFTEVHIPDSVFENDLKYETALGLIRRMQGIRRRPRPHLRRQAEQHAGDAQPQDVGCPATRCTCRAGRSTRSR